MSKSNVIHLGCSARQACVISKAIKERAKNVGATDSQRRRALVLIGIPALREGRSTATAVALSNSEFRPRRLAVANTGPEVA
jgi:hypothetical protein